MTAATKSNRKHRREPTVPLILRAIAGVTLFILLAPVAIVVLAGLNSGDHLSFPPEGLSFRWITAFFQSDIFLPAYGFSLVIALVTMVFSTVLGTMTSLFLVRTRFVGREFMRAFFMSPLMLPGIVLGLALYLFYISSGIGLLRTVPGLVVGHILVTCPYVIGTVSAALVGFDTSLEEAARSLGAGRFHDISQDNPAGHCARNCRGRSVLVHRVFRPVRRVAVPDPSQLNTSADGSLCVASLHVRAHRRRRGNLRHLPGRRVDADHGEADQSQTPGKREFLLKQIRQDPKETHNVDRQI